MSSFDYLDLEVLNGKNVIFFLETLEIGGAEKQALNLAIFLKDLGAKVKIIALRSPGQLTKLCDQLEIPWQIISYDLPANRLKKLLVLLKFFYQLRRAKPEILLAYTLVPNVLGGIVWRFLGARVFVWNQRDAGVFSLRNRWLVKLAASLARVIISNSDSGAKYLQEQFDLAREKIKIVPNGVKLLAPELARTAWREKLKVSSETFVVSMVANLSSTKDHLTLLRAWGLFVKQVRRDCRLVLAGRFDDMAEDIKRLIKEKGLSDSVCLLGQVTDVSGLLLASDLYVHSSISEGCPNSVIEAMLAGLPIVGTDISGIRFVVAPENLLYLSPLKGVKALAQNLVLLNSDIVLRARLGEENRNRAKDIFQLNKNLHKTAEIIAHAYVE